MYASSVPPLPLSFTDVSFIQSNRAARPREGIPRASALLRSAIPSEEESQDLGPILVKLLGFTVAMVVCPLGSYFLSRDYYFGEKNTTPPALLAATVANLILGLFIYLAIRSDLTESIEVKAKAKLAAEGVEGNENEVVVKKESKKDKKDK